MSGLLLAAIFAFASPAQVADAASSPAPSAAPLREIVYRFSYDSRVERSYGDYGAAAPETGSSSGGYSGRMVVDVMQAASDGLLVHVTETTNAENGSKPIDADIVVLANGGLKVVRGAYDQSMTMLLPYFGQDCFNGNALQQGNTWGASSKSADGVEITTTYNVTDVSGDLATITSSSAPTPGQGGATSMHVDTKVVYKATLLVPISISVVIRGSGENTLSSNELQDTYHFDRVSDTRDVPAGS
jgi:hypothetical protein